MLSRGFKDQIYDVYRYLPPELQVSATLQKTTLSKFNIILRKQILFSPRSPPLLQQHPLSFKVYTTTFPVLLKMNMRNRSLFL
jgi:hypothetical protein